MPDRYWVGGTASWDGTAGTKWSATSGGPGGASVPTTADDVFFDANSNTGAAITVTLAAGNTGARSINCTGFTRTIAGSASITVSGNVTLSSAMTVNHSGNFIINATSTITSSGCNFNTFLQIDGVGITVTLGDALTQSTRNITVTRGTFNTNNFNLTTTSFNSSNSNVRSVSFGSSTVSIGAWETTSTTNLTFNAGTSQINLTGSTSNLFTGNSGLTLHNVSYTSNISGTRLLFGSNNVFNNLTIAAPTTGMSEVSISGNMTVNGTLTAAGASATRRCFLRSSSIGIPRTITAAAISASDCDFRDITLAGAASPASPTRAGNCGGNSGITFPAAKTVYRVDTDTNWVGSNSWALTSGGTGSDNNFPLAQDTVVINNDTALTGTLALAAYNIGALDASTRTTGITLNHNVAVNRYGSYTLGSGVTVTGSSTQTFSGRGTMDFSSAGKTITFSITINAPGGTFRLLDALTQPVSLIVGVTHSNGTLDLNGFNLTVGAGYATNAGTRNLTFNGGTLTCPSSAPAIPFNNSAPVGFTTTAGTGTGTINMTGATAKTFAGGGSTYNCTLNNGGAGALTITGSNTFTTLSNTVQPTTFLFTAGTTTTVTNWNINGTAGNLVTIGSATAASHTLSKASGTVIADYLSISRSNATGGAAWYAGANSTDGGNNSGWVFGAAAAIIAALAASEVGPDTFAADVFIGPRVIAALAASEVGPDILAADAFIGYNVLAALAASEVGPDIFAALATISAAPQPVLGGLYPIELRSFTERRRF